MNNRLPLGERWVHAYADWRKANAEFLLADNTQEYVPDSFGKKWV